MTQYLYPQDFGAVADSVGPGTGTLNTTAIDAWFAAMIAQKKPGKVEGLFRYQPSGIWNLTGQNWEFSVTGDRRNGDGFAIEPGYQLRLETDPGADGFYTAFEKMWISGYFDGPLFVVGRDDFASTFNEFVMYRVNVNNGYPSNNNEAIRLNSVIGGGLTHVGAACGGSGRVGSPYAPGWGTALKLRQARQMSFKGTFGNGKFAIWMTSGYNYGNEFQTVDLEEVDTALKIDNAQSVQNMFSSGTFVARQLFACSAGNTNVIEKTVNRNGVTGTITGLEIR